MRGSYKLMLSFTLYIYERIFVMIRSISVDVSICCFDYMYHTFISPRNAYGFMVFFFFFEIQNCIVVWCLSVWQLCSHLDKCMGYAFVMKNENIRQMFCFFFFFGACLSQEIIFVIHLSFMMSFFWDLLLWIQIALFATYKYM